MNEDEEIDSIMEGRPRIRKQDGSKEMSRLCYAASKGMSSAVISSYASRCHDVSAPGPNRLGHTPLHIGAGHGNLIAMKTLIRLGACIDAPALSRATPLHLAVQAGQLHAARLLVSKSANLEARDWFGKTALHHACDYARMNGLDNNAACFLIEAGANVHIWDFCRNTPATLVMRMDNPPLLGFVLRNGPQPSRDLACLYAAEYVSKRSDKLLEILAEYGWAPPPPRSHGGNSRRDDTANGTGSWSENDLVGSACGRIDSHDESGEDRGSLLHDAVSRRDGGAYLVQLLAMGEDPNVPNLLGTPPLMMAACYGSVVKVEALLRAGAALNFRHPQNGFTAIHVSAEYGHVEVTEVLLAVAISNNRNSTSSRVFARDIAPCSSVMEGGVSPSPPSSPRTAAAYTSKACPPPVVVDVMDDVGRSPLHVAAINNNVEVMEVLLGAGAAVDSRDKRGRTPLFDAAKNDNAEAVIALLKADASPDIKDSSGHAALHVAVLRPAGAVLEALLGAGASPGVGGERGFTPLHVACESDTRGTVEALLRAGAVPGHCWNDSLQSPLMSACRYGSLNAVKLLLPHLSARQINMRNRMFVACEGGETPLVAAVWNECLDESDKIKIVEELLKAGADPTLTTSSFLDPLAAVVVGDNTKASPMIGPPLVRALVAAGADINGVHSPRGFAPLHLACAEGACGEVVQALLDAGADPCMPCAGSMQYAGMPFMTPLQLAGAGGNVEAVSVLISHPACGGLNAVGASPSRATVLACAVRHGKTEVCRLLLELGADMDLLPFHEKSRDGTGLPPKSLIEMAARFGHLDAMKLLVQAKLFKDQAEREKKEEADLPRTAFGTGRGRVKVS